MQAVVVGEHGPLTFSRALRGAICAYLISVCILVYLRTGRNPLGEPCYCAPVDPQVFQTCFKDNVTLWDDRLAQNGVYMFRGGWILQGSMTDRRIFHLATLVFMSKNYRGSYPPMVAMLDMSDRCGGSGQLLQDEMCEEWHVVQRLASAIRARTREC